MECLCGIFGGGGMRESEGMLVGKENDDSFWGCCEEEEGYACVSVRGGEVGRRGKGNGGSSREDVTGVLAEVGVLKMLYQLMMHSQFEKKEKFIHKKLHFWIRKFL